MDFYQRVEQRTRELSEEVESRSRAEVALRESENLLRLITDALPVYIAYIDADGRYRFANKSHEAVFEKSRDSIIGSRVDDLLNEEDYAIVREHLDATLRGEHREFEGNCGGYYRLVASATSVCGSSRILVGMARFSGASFSPMT